jgi:hypothetical protein
LVLLVAPWFVMQPALGLGFMAARIGLYVGAVAVVPGGA